MKLTYTIFVLLLLFSQSIFSQDAVSEFKNVDERKDWNFTISPYVWMAGNATDMGGNKLRQSFNDLSSVTNFGFQMATTARYKRFTAMLDMTYLQLSGELGNDALSVNAHGDQWIVDPKLGYIIYDKIEYNEDNVIAGWSLEANLGAKYWKNDMNIDYSLDLIENFPIEGTIEEKREWWDLMVGVKTRLIISKKVFLSLDGDIGGFGLGNSSKLAWGFAYANTFKISELIMLSAGYRSLRYKRTDGTGADELKTKVSAYGPFVGIAFVL